MKKGVRPYRQTRRAQSAARTRANLMEAAVEPWRQKDIDAISLDDIAAQASTTRQTLLRHFGSREGLLEAILLEQSSIERERDRAPVGDVRGAPAVLLGTTSETVLLPCATSVNVRPVMERRNIVILLGLLLTWCGACSSDPKTSGVDDTGSQVESDVEVTGTDASPDVGADTSPEVGADTSPEAERFFAEFDRGCDGTVESCSYIEVDDSGVVVGYTEYGPACEGEPVNSVTVTKVPGDAGAYALVTAGGEPR